MTAKPKPKRRRPARPIKVDPLDVLRAILSDPAASAELKFRAASKLLAEERRAGAKPATPAEPDLDPITRRALEIAADRQKGRPN